MNSRLNRIEHWPQLAHAARYRAPALAAQLGYSRRQLERYTRQTHGCSLVAWLNELRMRRALELVPECSTMGEIAERLFFNEVGNFSRAFKKFYGVAPSLYAARVPLSQKVATG